MPKVEVKGTIVKSGDQWIYDLFKIDATSPKVIKEAIASANGEPLDVDINSGGGNIAAGSEIYAALRAYKGRISIHVTGLAASAASVIMCAGHSDAAPTAMVMVHNVSTYSNGDYRDMDRTSDSLKQANRSIAAAYVAKCGISEDEALAMMDKETWLTAQDAVDKGLIDEISEPKNIELVASYGDVLPYNVIKAYRDKRDEVQKRTDELMKLEVKE